MTDTLRSLSFAIVAGLLIGLAGAPSELSFPAFLAPAALLLAIEPAPGRLVRARRALLYGFAAGFVTNAYSMYWVVGLLETFGRFPLVAALPTGALLWAAQSLVFATAAMVAVLAMSRGAPGWIALPAALATMGTLTPALFPWRFGLSQLPFLPYAQVAELGGLPLLDWLVATVGCATISALRTRRAAPALAAVLAFVLPPLYGWVRLDQVRTARAAARELVVGVVQPNVGIFEKHDPRLHVSHLRRLRAMTRELEARGAELVLWPESSYPFPIHRDDTHDRAQLGVLGEGARGPILAGTISTDGPRATAYVTDERGRFTGSFELGSGRRFNSAVGIERGGRVAGIADKVQLLAFGEYVPLWDLIPPLQRFPRGLTPGAGAQIVTIAGARVGVLNCYEDLLATHVQEQARLGLPDFWANLTNNAWFGDTSAPHLHHMNARLRAIETRRDLVRAVNTGVSGHTLATGEDAARTGTFVPASFLAEVRVLEGTTPWVALGDWVTPALYGAILAFVIARRRRGGA